MGGSIAAVLGIVVLRCASTVSAGAAEDPLTQASTLFEAGPTNGPSQIQANARPCEHSPVHRQFDFWEGDWQVRTRDGKLAGTNRIERVAGGCALLESWTSARSSYAGRSLNYFDPARRKWVQVWSDSTGSMISYRGGLTDGSMRLEGELVDRDGRKSSFRGTWTPLPDGRVHQLLEKSKDGGKTWSPWFDGFYSRKEAGKADQE